MFDEWLLLIRIEERVRIARRVYNDSCFLAFALDNHYEHTF